MRLAQPVYESLPYTYIAVGGLAISVFYIDTLTARAMIAFAIGLLAETAALTLILRRLDYRSLSREYSGETIDVPASLRGS